MQVMIAMIAMIIDRERKELEFIWDGEQAPVDIKSLMQ